MKTNLIKSVFTIALAVLSCINVHAQEKKVFKGEIPAPVKKQNNELRKNRNAVSLSEEAIEFQSRMRSAKESGSRKESSNLLKDIDEKLGTKTVSIERRERPAKDISNLNLQLDNFDTSKIYQSENFNTKFECVTTCTEQRGAHAGRIWTSAIFKVGEYTYYIGVFYSDNNGAAWNVYSVFDAYVHGQFGTVNFFKFTIDSELIEGNNSRILYITYPSYILIPSGVGPINGLVRINLNTEQIDLGLIEWPGCTLLIRRSFILNSIPTI